MTASRRKWLRRVVLGGILAGLALAVWFAHARGWLAPLYARAARQMGADDASPASENGGHSMPGMEMPGGDEPRSGVPGYAVVRIEPGLQQRIGVTVGAVKQEPLRMSVKTVGIVQPDETKASRVHIKTNGWVEELFVDVTGQKVRQGDPLLSIYSPDFLSAQEEYLIARGTGRRGDQGPTSMLARASLRKLELWDVPADELKELERTGRPKRYLTLRSPQTGTVLEKNVLEGEYLTPQRELYAVADLSTVWVQAKVYQYELPHIELGKPATVTVPGYPQRRFSGKVVFIQPTVEPATRTVQVRIELPNPEDLFKPEMFVEVEIQHPMGTGLLVPTSAVIRTGDRDVVFRVQSDHRFVPVEVEIGEFKFGDDYHVLKGLKAGDRVVTSGNFLIDSESRLRFGGGGMPGMPGMEMEMRGMDDSKMKD